MGNSLRILSIGICASLMVGCNSTSQLDADIRNVELPANWQDTALQGNDSLAIKQNWLSLISSDNQLQSLVSKALSGNHQLRQQAYTVEIRKQQYIATGANLWPSLDVGLTHTRRKTSSVSTNFSGSLDLSYQIDIWGKLSDSERQSHLTYLAEKAKFDQSRQQLVANVVDAWYSVIEAEQLVALYNQRVANSKQNLEIIEMGYRQGLNKALDVYLTRNELNNELSRLAQQEDTLIKAKRQLERLAGDYPQGVLEVAGDLPLLQDEIPAGLPSELIGRKPQLISAWYELLAKDAGLAFAHKQRFPSLTLRADLSNGGDSLSDVLSGSTGWSLINSLTAPIFDAGKLKSQEEQARLSLKQGEQSYLDSLYGAFNDVESALSTEQALKQRYKVMVEAEKNALAAQTLSFEQYQNGLVSYTTVLDAQSRAFDAQSTVIQLKKQLLSNRVKLHVALGGDFDDAQKFDTGAL